MASPLLSGNVSQLLLLFSFAKKYHDFPANFTLPALSDPNYVPPYRGTSVLVVAYLMMILSFISVSARLYVRRFTGLRKLGWDDWVIIPATIMTLGYTIVQGLVVEQGCAGRHIYDVSFDKLRYSYIFTYGGTMIYIGAGQLIKTSILLFIYRLAPYTNRTLRLIIIATQVFIAASSVGSVLTITLNCRPIRAVWDADAQIDPNTKCGAVWASVLGWAVVFAVTDLWLVVLPINMVWKLQIPKKTRYGILFVFACGLAAAVAAIFKAATLRSSYDTYDPCWKFSPSLITSQLELTFGLIAASLPALNHLFVKHVLSKFLGYYHEKKASRPSKDEPKKVVSTTEDATTKPSNYITTSTFVTTDYEKRSKDETMDVSQVDTKIETGGWGTDMMATMDSSHGWRTPVLPTMSELRSLPTMSELSSIDDTTSHFSVELVFQEPP